MPFCDQIFLLDFRLLKFKYTTRKWNEQEDHFYIYIYIYMYFNWIVFISCAELLEYLKKGSVQPNIRGEHIITNRLRNFEITREELRIINVSK